MSLKRLSAVALILAGLFAQTAFSQSRLTVSKNADHEAMFSSLQAAINQATNKGDIIEILDVAEYREQITIDSTKSNLTIRSANPTSHLKPVIIYKDTINREPSTWQNSQNPSLSGQFEQCGALRIIRAHNVTLNGITVDGGGAAPFSWPGIWNQKDALFHGNAAVAVVVASGAVIRNCYLRNAYYGISVKDRNVGGAFAIPNPADIDKAIPLSDFSKGGNHLFEYNRIHDNSVGIFLESVWDLGSTIRHNLIYNNYHKAGTKASNKNVSDGVGGWDFVSGAISFKDNYLSPMAIYNNTLYNNNVPFIGGWQVAAQHLIFNNIISKRNKGDTPDSQGKDFLKNFPYRVHNTVVSADNQVQLGGPQNFQVEWQYGPTGPPPTGGQCTAAGSVTWASAVQFDYSGFTSIQGATPVTFYSTVAGCEPPASQGLNQNIVRPGQVIALFGGASSSSVRWLQTEGYTSPSLPQLFKHVHPDSTGFLEPDWTKQEVKDFIQNKGWTAVGMYSADGKVADIGAIQSGGRQPVVARIKPAEVVLAQGKEVSVEFSINVEGGDFKEAKVKFLRWIYPLDIEKDQSGENAAIIASANIIDVTPLPSNALNTVGGINTITFNLTNAIPADKITYGFFELVIEGKDGSGNPVTTDVGFLTFRQLSYRLRIAVFPPTGLMTPATELKEVRAGDSVRIQVTPMRLSGSTEAPWPAPNKLDSLSLSLGSDPVKAKLYNWDGTLFPQTIKTLVSGSNTFNVIFVKATSPGDERVSGSATGIDDGAEQAFRGGYNIKVRPGDPAQVAFIDPLSVSQLAVRDANGVLTGDTALATAINPGATKKVVVEVQDKYENPVDVVVSVNLALGNQNPAKTSPDDCDIGNIITPTANTHPDSGRASFDVGVGCGQQNNWFDMVASTPNVEKGGTATDTGRFRIGRTQDRLYIFYGKSSGADGDYSPGRDNVSVKADAEIRGGGNEKVRVYVRAVSGGKVMDGATFKVCLTTSALIDVYTDSTGAGTPGANGVSITLVDGEGHIWISSNFDVPNGSIQAAAFLDGCGGTPDNLINRDPGRNYIFFEKPSSNIQGGIVYGNGNGIPDTMTVTFGGPDAVGSFTDPINTWPMPEKAALRWPADTTNDIYAELKGAYVVSEDIEVDVVNDGSGRSLMVIFKNPLLFNPGYTSIVNDVLGSVYWDGNDGKGLVWHAFSIKEKVGPIISKEGDRFIDALSGRIGPMIMDNTEKLYQDTLMIQISETIKNTEEVLAGASIQHKKSGGAAQDITVASAQRRGEWIYLVLAGAPGDVTSGDSIRLNPARGILDLEDNAVQADNRWVELKLKPLPAGIVSENSFYENSGLDGKPVNLIDYVQVEFTKPVNFSHFDSLKIKHNNGVNAECKVNDDMISSEAIYLLTGMTKTIGIKLAQVFPGKFGSGNDDLHNLTSGAMELAIVYKKNNGVTDEWTNTAGSIKDRAKPVLVSKGDPKNDDYEGAVFKSGAPRGDGSGFERDTLIITYSEKLAPSFMTSLRPLVFYKHNNVNPTYVPTFEKIASNQHIAGRGDGWHRVTYIVPEGGFVGFELEVTDSVYINVNSDPAIADSVGGNKHGGLNKKIPIRIETKLSWNLAVKNNPFSPKNKGRDFTTVVFSPGLKVVSEDLRITATVMLYDNMGHLVIKEEVNNEPKPGKPRTDKVEWVWKGHNKRGRLVGSGTYHMKAVIEVKSESRGISDRTTEIRAIGFVR